MRNFEKISLKKFKEETNLKEDSYEKIILPKRSTHNSAGYDFSLIEDVRLNPNEIKKIPTGIKAKMENDEFLMIIIRSSLGTKHNLRLCNQVGIVDSDYYDNQDNEGHIWLFIKNEGNEIVNLKQDERIVQGIFLKYLKTENDETKETRKGGFGSTNSQKGEWIWKNFI